MLVYSVSLEYEITKARLLMNTTPVKIEVDTEKSGYQIKNHPIKMEIDNTAFFESLNIKSPEKVLKDSAEYGKRAALKAAARYSEEGEAMLGPDGMTIAEIAAQRTYRTIASALDFIPKSRPETSWKDGYLDMDYIEGERNVEWTPSEIEFEYVPYKVEIHAVRQAKEFETANLGAEN